MAEDIKRISCPQDPNRCQQVTAFGQCTNLKIPGQDFCKVHGCQTRSIELEQNRNYLLTKWQARLEQKTLSPNIKSLRDEIGILRMMLEEQLNRCNDPLDLVLQSAAISDLVLKIEKLVTSCHRLENAMGQLLDKAALLQFASEIITILQAHITDPVVLSTIADQIATSISSDNTEASV